MPWLPAGSMPSMALGLPVMPPAMPALRAAPFVHDASYMKALFLAAIAKGEASWPLVSKEAAVEMLGTMRGGCNAPPLVDALDDQGDRRD